MTKERAKEAVKTDAEWLESLTYSEAGDTHVIMPYERVQRMAKALRYLEAALDEGEPTKDMLVAAKDALSKCHAGDIDYIAKWQNSKDEMVNFVACPAAEYKAMRAASPTEKLLEEFIEEVE